MDGEASCMKGALKAPFCLLFTSCSPLIFAFSPLLSFTAGNAEAPAVPLTQGRVFPRKPLSQPLYSQVLVHFKPIYTLLQCQFIPPPKLSSGAEGDGARLILLIGLMVETRMMQMRGSKQKQGKYSVYSFERGKSEGVAGKPERPHPGDEPWNYLPSFRGWF